MSDVLHSSVETFSKNNHNELSLAINRFAECINYNKFPEDLDVISHYARSKFSIEMTVEKYLKIYKLF